MAGEPACNARPPMVMGGEASADRDLGKAESAGFPPFQQRSKAPPMSTTFQLDTSTSRANPTPQPMRRLTVPAIRQRKIDGVTAEPIVVLTAYTARQAQLLDQHCDILLVGDSLGQVIYGLPSTIPVTMDMMAAHGAAVVRGSYHSLVAVDMPFGSYEASPEDAFDNAATLLKESGAAAVKLEGGEAMAETVAFLVQRGIPVIGHVGLTPQAVNVLGGYGARGRDKAEANKIVADAKAVDRAGAFAIVVEGVIEPLAVEITKAVSCPTIGIGASAQCDGQVLVTEDMLGMFERVPRFVKRYENIAETIAAAAARYAGEVRTRSFPGPDQTYQPG
jgi:3-methyl-2-oxobutanoate hydroxymethyltransferase